MTAEKGTPAWYKEAELDFMRKGANTELSRAVVEEARAMLFSGMTIAQANKALKDKGMSMHRAGVVARAAKLEWDAIVGAASTDFDAGQTDSPQIASARRLALEITREDPSGGDFRKKLAAHGASDGLAAYLASDPAVNSEANKTGRTMLIFGIIGIVASVFFGFAMFGAGTQDNSSVGGLGALLVASVTGIWRGLVGMTRKAGAR